MVNCFNECVTANHLPLGCMLTELGSIWNKLCWSPSTIMLDSSEGDVERMGSNWRKWRI